MDENKIASELVEISRLLVAGPSAKQEYDSRYRDIQKMLRSIGSNLKKHSKNFEKEPMNWGYVGDLGHYREELKDISDSLSGSGEYA
jgi:hypothetical protein